MGVGKTTVGARLARLNGWKFIDTDHLVSLNTGKSIAEIFNTLGEESFRLYEKQALLGLIEKSSHPETITVVALGGGILSNLQNLELIQKSGLLIYLAASAETMQKRLSATGGKRPLLAGLREDQRSEKIQELIKQRNDQYNKAQHCILTDKKTATETVNELNTLLHGLWQKH